MYGEARQAAAGPYVIGRMTADLPPANVVQMLPASDAVHNFPSGVMDALDGADTLDVSV